MSASVHTFSGTHPFDPTVLNDTDADEQGTADQIIGNIEARRCRDVKVRCRPGRVPCRVTDHPVQIYPDLRPLRHRRVYEQLDGATVSVGLSSAGEWPLDPETSRPAVPGTWRK